MGQECQVTCCASNHLLELKFLIFSLLKQFQLLFLMVQDYQQVCHWFKALVLT